MYTYDYSDSTFYVPSFFSLSFPLFSTGFPVSLSPRHLTQFTRDLLTDSLSPHVAYLLLPHLTQSNISPASVIQAVYTSLLSGSLPPSRSLLYSLLQLVHNKLSEWAQIHSFF